MPDPTAFPPSRISPTSIPPVRISVIVNAPREHAFTVFTRRFDAWWPRAHHTGQVDLAEVRLEPQEGGRWFEVMVDGSEADWGSVLVWDPPGRLVLDWQLDATFSYDPDFHTEVEVTFTADGPDRTHVVLVHRDLERYGERADELRESLGSGEGWPAILGCFALLTSPSPEQNAEIS